MPAVAQINVNFANRLEFTTSIPDTGVTTVKSISPYTLLQYLMYNRENEDQMPPPPTDIFLAYEGGYISAGDKINVKHSNFQIRQNLDIEKNIYTEFIYSRRKGDTDTTYQLERSTASRAITIAPFDNLTNNYINIITAGTLKQISFYTSNTSNPVKDNKIIIKSEGTTRSISSETDIYTVTANTVLITPGTSTVTIDGDTTLNKNVTIVGNNTAGLELFKIKNGSGNDMFIVESSNGNTETKGTLLVQSSVTLNGTVGSIAGITTTINGATSINNTLTVLDNVTINKNFTMFGSDTPGTETFRILDGSSNTEFSVDSSNGNTSTQGTLNVESTSTFADTITMDGGATKFTNNRRIIGVRRFNSSNEMFGSTTYDEDVLAVGDFKLYAFRNGMIMMFTGSALPPNWYWCDGQNGTPDLRDKFVKGRNPMTSRPGTVTGGYNSRKIAQNHLPSHSHNIVGVTDFEKNHTHTESACGQDPGGGGGDGTSADSRPGVTGGGGEHSHSIGGTTTNNTVSIKSGKAAGDFSTYPAISYPNDDWDNQPEFYLLAYIMYNDKVNPVPIP